MSKLIIYPEYDKRIKRSLDYEVTVNKDGVSYRIPVYNEIRQSASTREPWGDDFRRFCEFAFEGGNVRVDITVNMSFDRYTVMPAAANLKSGVKGNVISVYLDRPQIFMIRLGDRVNTMLAVFADAPEYEVPEKNDENVIFIDSWYENETGLLNLSENQTLYIAPGAVCNARVIGKGNNIKVIGRGMVRDPYDVRSNNVHAVNYNVNITESENPVVKGIKICDCRFYHLFFGDCKNVHVDGVKLLSNVISNDGFRVHNVDTMTLENCYADIGDDVFTLSGDTPDMIKNLTYRNIICGSTCGIFSFTNKKTNVKFENISVFRCNESMFKNFYTSLENTPFSGVEIENLFAVDCVYIPSLFSSRSQGKGLKDVHFKNVSMIRPAGIGAQNMHFSARTGNSIILADGSDYKFTLENIFIDGKICTDTDGIGVEDNSENKAKFTITASGGAENSIPLFANTTVLDTPYTAPKKTYAPVKDGENLLSNGGFEEGVGAWGTNGFAFLALSDDPHSGKYCLYVPCKRPHAGTSRSLKEIFLRAGRGVYKFSFYAKRGELGEFNDAVFSVAYSYGEVTENEDMPGKAFEETFTLESDWKLYTYKFELETDPENVNTAYMTVKGVHKDGAVSFYLDDVKIEKIK